MAEAHLQEAKSRFKQPRTSTSGCPRCGEPRTVEVIIQARPTPSRRGTLATRAKGMCESCAEDVFKRMEAILDEWPRRVTTSASDPIVQACIDHGGHFWPADAPEDEPATCTRCWYNPGWKAGKTRNETELRPVEDRPQA